MTSLRVNYKMSSSDLLKKTKISVSKSYEKTLGKCSVRRSLWRSKIVSLSFSVGSPPSDGDPRGWRLADEKELLFYVLRVSKENLCKEGLCGMRKTTTIKPDGKNGFAFATEVAPLILNGVLKHCVLSYCGSTGDLYQGYKYLWVKEM